MLAQPDRPARPATRTRSTAARWAKTSPAPSVYNDDVIRPRGNPLVAARRPRRAARQSRARRRGDQAGGDGGAPAAAHRARGGVPRLQRHGRAHRRSRRSSIDKDSVIVLQSAGPQGAPGLPEWGQLPIPKKLLKQGVRDMVRISDARMSGTSYGACVLHVAPESHIGGPLALVRDGDLIELDVPARKLDAAGRRRGTGAPPRGMDAAETALHARLRHAVSQARHAGQRRLRLRFPRGRRSRRPTRKFTSHPRSSFRRSFMNRRISFAAIAAATVARRRAAAGIRAGAGPASPSRTSCRSRPAARPTSSAAPSRKA